MTSSKKLFAAQSNRKLLGMAVRLPHVRLGIRTLLIAGMVIVIGTLMAITTFMDVQRQEQTEREDMEERGFLLTNSLNNILANPIRAKDLQSISEIAKAIWAQPDVSFVRVFDAQGYQLVGPGQDQYPAPGVQDVSAVKAVSNLHPMQRWTQDGLEVTGPVSAGSTLVGVVHFGFDGARIDDEMRALTINRLWETAALIVAGIGISFILASYITGPIRVLVRATNRLAGGDLSARVYGLHGRELRNLGASFNRMADELEDKVVALQESRARIVTAQESIRRDIAVHLHGPVQGRLLALKGQLQLIKDDGGVSPELNKRLNTIVENMGEVIQEEISSLSRRLYPAIVRRGTVPALQSLADQFERAVEVNLDLDNSIASQERTNPGVVAEPTRLAVYRIAEEAFSNVVKHSNAKRVDLRLDVVGNSLVLGIQDDGSGFEMQQHNGGLGLPVMLDYAEAVGGTCEIESTLGHGTIVTATLPLS